MLAATKKFNAKYMGRRDAWLDRRNQKINCKKCKFEEISGEEYVAGDEGDILRVRGMMMRMNDEKMLMDEPDVVERLGWTCEECGPGMSARELDVCE